MTEQEVRARVANSPWHNLGLEMYASMVHAIKTDVSRLETNAPSNNAGNSDRDNSDQSTEITSSN